MARATGALHDRSGRHADPRNSWKRVLRHVGDEDHTVLGDSVKQNFRWHTFSENAEEHGDCGPPDDRGYSMVTQRIGAVHVSRHHHSGDDTLVERAPCVGRLFDLKWDP